MVMNSDWVIKAMASGSSSSSATSKRGKSFRKLRWKNYLNHLLNLWLYCGSVLVDGRNDGENGSNVVNLFHKSDATTARATFTSPFPTRSLKTPDSKSHKSLPEVSQLNGSIYVESSPHGDGSSSEPDSTYDPSNKASSSENYFHSIKSRSLEKGLLSESTNHETSLDRSSALEPNEGRTEAAKHENIVNTTRITNVIGSVKHVNRVNGTASVESVGGNLNDRNQSSSGIPKKPEASSKSVKRKSKSQARNPANAPNATVKTLSNRKAVKKLSKVSLLGLFELTTHLGTRWEGKSELAAAELAVKHINERRLLPGYLLELITNDTQVRWARLRNKWNEKTLIKPLSLLGFPNIAFLSNKL